MAHSDWITQALNRYERILIRYAAGILGDTERARDVVQDTFLRLCRQKRQKVDGHLGQWLFTVCRHRALDIVRKGKRVTTLETQVRHLAGDSPLPGQELEKEESLSQVLTILESLPPNQREVIRLKFQGELSYREISAVTGLSVSNVGFLIHTGLKTIRKRLAAGDRRSSTAAIRRIK